MQVYKRLFISNLRLLLTRRNHSFLPLMIPCFDVMRVFAYRLLHGNNPFLPDNNHIHPAMSIPELIRLLMNEGLDFDAAFELTRRVFAYTNHTVMGEALEKWDLELLRSVVPEVCEIIERIDARSLTALHLTFR